MKRQGAHSETNGSPKQPPLTQQQDFEANYSAGRGSSLSAEGAPLRKSAKVEWLWQLERENSSPALSKIPPHNEVLERQSADKPYNPFQPSVLSHQLKEEQQEACKEQEPNPELDMEVGYEDDRPMLSTLESIDHNFSDKLKQLDKQQQDAEDAEHTRHLERIIEISKEYREKRLSLRAEQAEQRRRLLEKEAAGEQLQHYHYKQQQHLHSSSPIAGSIMGFHQDSQERLYYSYRSPPSSTMTPSHHHHHPHYSSDVNELYSERYSQPLGMNITETRTGRATPQPQTQVREGRVPLPPGRVYNNTKAAASSSRYN